MLTVSYKLSCVNNSRPTMRPPAAMLRPWGYQQVAYSGKFCETAVTMTNLWHTVVIQIDIFWELIAYNSYQH